MPIVVISTRKARTVNILSVTLMLLGNLSNPFGMGLLSLFTLLLLDSDVHHIGTIFLGLMAKKEINTSFL